MSSNAVSSPTKPQKPKKVVMSTGRGGGGNFRKVQEKKYVTECAQDASTNKKVLEIELPRNKPAYSGRGGAGNTFEHVLEDGVFNRVIQYELGKVQASKDERDSRRRSTRSRTYSNAKSSKASTLGSDDVSSSSSQPGTPFRRSWASRSTADVAAHPSKPDRKTLRQTLLAPLRTTFNRRPNSYGSRTIKDDTSSFSIGSSTDLAAPAPSIMGCPFSPIDQSSSPIEPPLSPVSQVSDDAYSAVTPNTAEMFGELAGKPVPRRRSTGAHRSPKNNRLAPPLPSPSTPLPPIPPLAVDKGRESLPVPMPVLPKHPPPTPQTTPIKAKLAKAPVKSLQAIPAPVQAQNQLSTSYFPSGSFSEDRLAVPSPPLRSAASVHLRAPNRKMYDAAVAARSMSHLSAPMEHREASFYDDSDVDRVDPFLAQLTRGEVDKSFESLLPWIEGRNSSAPSVSSISMTSINESSLELVDRMSHACT